MASLNPEYFWKCTRIFYSIHGFVVYYAYIFFIFIGCFCYLEYEVQRSLKCDIIDPSHCCPFLRSDRAPCWQQITRFLQVSCCVWNRMIGHGGCPSGDYQGPISIWIPYFWYVDFRHEDKTVVRPSYLYDGNCHTDKTASLYWDNPRNFFLKYSLYEIFAWISNNTCSNLWYVATHTCPNFNGNRAKLPLKMYLVK